MIEFNITELQKQEALTLYKFKVLNNSIEKGAGNFAGALGEILFKDYYKNKDANLLHSQDYNYDFIFNNKKIEIKTARVNNLPKMHHHVNLSDHNSRQKCDFYFFIYVTNDYNKGWFVGYESKKKYFEIADFWLRGDKGDCNFVYQSDTYSTRLINLKQVNE